MNIRAKDHLGKIKGSLKEFNFGIVVKFGFEY